MRESVALVLVAVGISGCATPLMKAARDGRNETVRSLLDRGADVNAEDSAHRTALTFAVINNDLGTTRVLLEAGANPRGADEAPKARSRPEMKQLFASVLAPGHQAERRELGRASPISMPVDYGTTAPPNLSDVDEQLAKLPAKKITVVMDSCFSGAGGRSVIAAGARPLVNVVQAEVPDNITVISASAGDQISNSYQDKGHGLFSYCFLKGLKQKGEDLRAVYDYLKPEVSGYARRELNADQDPQWQEGK